MSTQIDDAIQDRNLLSTTVLEGLRNLGTSLSIDLSKLLISNALKLTLHPGATITPVPELYASQADKAKQSEYAVVTLLTIATKYGWDSFQLRQQLTTAKLHSSAIEELTRVYDDSHKDLVLRQLQLGHNFAHITDVQWRIVCDVKSSTADSSSGAANFLINLGRYRQESGERETIIEFLCHAEELQSLINRFKGIERHCDKIAALNDRK